MGVRKHPAQSAYSPEYLPRMATRNRSYNHVMTATRSAVIDSNSIMSDMLEIRGHRVLLDSDLAAELWRVVKPGTPLRDEIRNDG